MGIIWTIVIGFVAGVIAKFIMPGKNEPSGFVLTTILGIVGAFVASYLGQALGWYAPGEGAGLIGAVVGAIVVLFVWGVIAKRRVKDTRTHTSFGGGYFACSTGYKVERRAAEELSTEHQGLDVLCRFVVRRCFACAAARQRVPAVLQATAQTTSRP